MKTVTLSVTVSGPDSVLDEALEEARGIVRDVVDFEKDDDEDKFVSVEVRVLNEIAAGIEGTKTVYDAKRAEDGTLSVTDTLA